jgi:hypothetical protein
MAAPNLNFYPSPINNSPIPVCFARSSIYIKVIDGIWHEREEEQRIGIQEITVLADKIPNALPG